MATLEEAARQLVEQIGELDGDVEKTTGTLTDLRAKLKTVEKELDERIDTLEDEVDEFVAKVQAETARLSGDLDEAHQVMTQARTGIDQAKATATGAIDAAQQQTETLTSAVDDVPEAVDVLVTEQVETPAQALGDQARATGSALDAAVDATSGNVTAFTESLVELQERLPEAASGMGEAIRAADEHIGKAFVEWTSHLFEVVDLVENKGFEPAQENAEEVAAFALDECKKGLDEAVQDALERVGKLDEDFEALQEAITQAAGQVTSDTEQPVVSELGELRDAVSSAMDWLGTVEEWLNGYTFMK